MAEYGLSLYDASTLIEERATADWYEAVVRGGRNRDPKIAANWTISELFGALNKAGLDLADSPVSAAALGGLIELIGDGTLSGRDAKGVFAEMFATGKGPEALAEEDGKRGGEG